MKQANNDIRNHARDAKIPLWRVALHLGISEAAMTRMLRVELDEQKRTVLLSAINEIAQKEGDKK